MNARAMGWLLAAAGAVALGSCGGDRTTGASGPAAADDVTTVRSALTTVVVTVTNTGGTPQAGLTVYAQKQSTGAFVQTRTTNSQGVASFSLANASYRFATPGSGAFYFLSTPVCTTPGCTSASITVTAPVQVTVVDTSNVPQNNAEVLAEDASGYVNVNWTDASGHAPLSMVPGTYDFVTPGFGIGFLFHSAASCTVPGCTAATITVTTPVTVTVVDAQGNPVANSEVLALDASGVEVNMDYTDAQGHALLSVNPGAYRFVALNGPVMFPSGAPGSCVVPGCTTATITIPAPVVVTVVNGAGQPIANQTVKARLQGDDNTIVFATTDASGHVSFSLPGGGWRFQAICSPETFFSGDPGSCAIPGCTTASITMICGACASQPNGTACNDANPCTQTDTCQGGACVGSNPITCSAQDQCHDAGTCNMQTGACSNPARANGTSCSDGNNCTQSDTCQSGNCTGATPVTCSPQDQCHDAGTCNPSTGVCTNPPKANGSACNDGNACTLTDTCQSGVCTGSNPMTCAAQGECTTGACVPATGACTNPPIADGTICTGGLCAAGVCRQAGNPPTPVDPTVPMDLQQTTAFLYEGSNPQQIGVPDGTIKRDRVGVCRGKVTDRNGLGVKGVVIRVVGRPEYGFTQTGDDGVFSLAVNGGQQLSLRYERKGFLPVQRSAFAQALDYSWFPEVVLTPIDPARTTIDLSNPTAIQVAQATPTSDASGTRQSVLLFSPDTQATAFKVDGTSMPLPTLTVHSTEYTVGSQGLRAMPVPLPPSSGYTYAVELTAEEADTDDVRLVSFNRPVINYVDNFLHFPVGTPVPLGSGQAANTCWLPEPNGVVIEILDSLAGLAEIDIDGDGQADDAATLAAAGITDDERTTLATLYLPGLILPRIGGRFRYAA
jgi:hypothetical protein